MTAARPLLAAALALLLGGCEGAEALLTASRAPEPVELSSPSGARSSALDPAIRDAAGRVAGAYLRVEIIDRSEVRAGRDGAIAPGVITGASGVIVDARGYAVTAAHVATRAGLEVWLTTTSGRRHDGRVVAFSPERELALIAFKPYPGMVVARMGSSAEAAAGDAVFGIGTPDSRPGVVYTGIVLNPWRGRRIQYGQFGYDDAIELALKVEPGVSGGPLFSDQGELLGIVASFALGNTNPEEYGATQFGWAVPVDAIKAYLAEVAGS